MKKLTAKEVRSLIQQLRENESNPRKGLTGDEKVYLPALEIALPILEQQESDGATDEHNDYLYLVLVPLAEAFRSDFPEGTAQFLAISRFKQFSAISRFKQCRVKFFCKRLEREWQEFCKQNELNNDTSLEY